MIREVEESLDCFTDHDLIYWCIHVVYMARLYWRVKVNGKWTWRPAVYDMHRDRYDEIGGCEVTLWWPIEVKEDVQ